MEMKKNIFTEVMQPTRFTSLGSNMPEPSTWAQLVGEMQSGVHAPQTTAYRDTLRKQEAAEESGNTKEAERLKKHKTRIKRLQPAFLCGVIVERGRSSAHIKAFTGLYMIDFDCVEPKQMADVLKRIRADGHTFLAHTTLSGRGIRVIARGAVCPDEHSFVRHWTAANEYYAQLTGLAYDSQCKNPTRLSVLCHDADVYFNPDATPLPPPTQEKSDKETTGNKAGRPRNAQSAAAVVRQLVEQEDAAYVPGRHNDYVCRCLYWMNRFGVGRKHAQEWAMQEFADYEATHPGAIAGIVRSCYAKTHEYGTYRLADYGKKGKASTQHPQKASLEDMEYFITHRYRLRKNMMSHAIEYQPVDGDGKWIRIDDSFENSLWCAMKRQGIHTDLFSLRALLISDFVPEHKPFHAYLDTLPPWDGTTDYIGMLWARVHCKDTDAQTFDYFARRWLVAMVASALDERVVNHQILVLLGRQGTFKSSFMENLLPPELRAYYTSKTNSMRLTKDDHFALTENLLINFEEIDSMSRQELNQLKAMTTVTHIQERPPYGRNKVRLPHVASFCATGNNLQFLTDDTGNRRWMPFEVEYIENPWTNPLPYDGIYAQAKALLDSGFRYWLKDNEIDRLHNHNRQYETPNMARELVLSYFRKPHKDELPLYLSSTQILSRFPPNVRVSATQIGKAMKDLEYKQIRTKSARFWEVVERSGFDITHSLPEDPW